MLRFFDNIKTRIKKINFLGILGLIIIVIIWFGLSQYFKIINPERASILMPSPLQVITESLKGLSSYYGMNMPGEYSQELSYGNAFLVIGYHSFMTIARLLIGVTIGIVVGVLIGMLLAWNNYLKWLFEIPILIIRAIPPLALIPLFLIWFGGNELGNITYIAFVIASMISINTIVAIGNVNPIYRNFAFTLGANKWRVFRTVVLPTIIPELGGGIRVVIGISWAVTLGAEYLAAQTGLGRIMILSEKFLFTGRMIIIILLFMLYAFILNQLFLRILNRITKWKE